MVTRGQSKADAANKAAEAALRDKKHLEDLVVNFASTLF